MRADESAFVRSDLRPTNDTRSVRKRLSRRCIFASSNLFTCPHGGLWVPQARQVVRPTRMSCLYGTPIRIRPPPRRRHPPDLRAAPRQKSGRNVLHDLGAQHEVECTVGKRQVGRIALHALHAGVVDRGELEVQRNDACEAGRHQARKVPVARADIQRGRTAARLAWPLKKLLSRSPLPQHASDGASFDAYSSAQASLDSSTRPSRRKSTIRASDFQAPGWSKVGGNAGSVFRRSGCAPRPSRPCGPETGSTGRPPSAWHGRASAPVGSLPGR